MSHEAAAAKLKELVQELHEESMLEGYAAEAAAAVLIENWTAAMRDGTPLADVVGDVDKVVELLAAFKAKAAAIPAPAAEEAPALRP